MKDVIQKPTEIEIQVTKSVLIDESDYGTYPGTSNGAVLRWQMQGYACTYNVPVGTAMCGSTKRTNGNVVISADGIKFQPDSCY